MNRTLFFCVVLLALSVALVSGNLVPYGTDYIYNPLRVGTFHAAFHSSNAESLVNFSCSSYKLYYVRFFECGRHDISQEDSDRSLWNVVLFNETSAPTDMAQCRQLVAGWFEHHRSPIMMLRQLNGSFALFEIWRDDTKDLLPTLTVGRSDSFIDTIRSGLVNPLEPILVG